MADTYEKDSCIRGYHVYKSTWIAMMGEMLACERDPRNQHDRYTVSVKKGNTTVGHLPKKISKLCSLFIRRGGSIQCLVNGSRRYSSDLPQGGLEIPCKLIFKGNTTEIKHLLH